MEPLTPSRILVAYGTRPEAIKMAPVVRALRARPDRCEVVVCATGQHREMLDQVHELFGIESEIDLELMRERQGLNELASRAFVAVDEVVRETHPDWVLVQGDTTSAMVAAFVAFHRNVKVGHVEAGLRTGDLHAPFPEEANRRVIDLLADALFAPTGRSRDVLLREGVDPSKIFLTGNTVVDALLEVSNNLREEAPPADEILVTVHRRESFGAPVREIFSAVRELAERFPSIRWVYPVHPNPAVREPAHELLAAMPNIELHSPFSYRELIRRLRRCRLVLTDSGGIQEEAPAFGKPVLVLRERTERTEGIEAGVAALAGVQREGIFNAAERLITDTALYQRMATATNPYGDGLAADRIASILTGEPWSPFLSGQANGEPS